MKTVGFKLSAVSGQLSAIRLDGELEYMDTYCRNILLGRHELADR